jgi:hypothetical protein
MEETSRRRSGFARLWAAVVVTVILSSCAVRQEIRFNPDGSGTVSSSVTIDRSCRPYGNLPCWARAGQLLGGQGPAAQARLETADLPFHVRIVPIESDPLEDSGYTLSFGFESVDDLEKKLIPAETAPFRITDATFERNAAGGFTFAARVTLLGYKEMQYDRSQPGNTSFAVVLPGRAVSSNAGFVESTDGGTRFQWNWAHASGANHGLPPQPLQASTCLAGQCPLRLGTIFAAGATAAVAVIVGVLLVRRSRKKRAARAGSYVDA